MGNDRRRQYRVQELGVEELVTELLSRGLTYEEIAEKVKVQSGEDIGKSSIARYNDGLQRRIKRVTEVREIATGMAKELKARQADEPDVDMSELLLDIAQNSLIERMGDDLGNKDLFLLASAGSKVVGAKASLENIKATERRRAQKAYDKVVSELKKLLQDSGLWPQVERVLAAGAPEGEAA